jgi:hypothetical protein
MIAGNWESWRAAFERQAEGFCDIGQWSAEVRRMIAKAVKRGEMGRYRDLNSFPMAKWRYYLTQEGGAE